MQRIGPFELGLIVLIILVLFGAQRLPEIGQSLGKAIRDFKKALQGDDKDSQNKDSGSKI